MSNSKVSIVTLSYNQGAFLPQAMDSVLSQDHKNLEYIIVDPGSTDGSRQIATGLGGEITKYVFKPDSGPGHGLNNGFALAEGGIFGFLNADDRLCPGALSQAAQILGQHSDIDIVSGDGLVIDIHGNAIRKVYSDKFTLNAYLHGAAVLVQPSTFFRRRVWEAIGGFNPGNKINWDGEFWAIAAKNSFKFYRCRRLWSETRLYPGTITSSRGCSQDQQAHWDALAMRLKGRPLSRLAPALRLWYLGAKYLSCPAALSQRIRCGSILAAAGISGPADERPQGIE